MNYVPCEYNFGCCSPWNDLWTENDITRSFVFGMVKYVVASESRGASLVHFCLRAFVSEWQRLEVSVMNRSWLAVLARAVSGQAAEH